MRPLIGITADNRENTAATGTYECAAAYCDAVAKAGGLPVILPHEVELVAEYVAQLHGFVFTGGVDPDTRPYGQPLHPQARVMDPRRQAFESAVLTTLQATRPRTPCLGICLGMQMMALHAGATLDQFLPDTLGPERTAAHERNRRHPLVLTEESGLLQGGEGMVVSSHRQAVAMPGRLRIFATAPDGVIEAVGDSDRPFYLGVQWHPERNDDAGSASLNGRLFEALIGAARSSR